MAVDETGNVFVADTGYGRVVELQYVGADALALSER
jgi:hypothetical protein